MTHLEISTIQKSTTLDLYMIFKEDPDKSYQADELWEIMPDYVHKQEIQLGLAKKEPIFEGTPFTFPQNRPII